MQPYNKHQGDNSRDTRYARRQDGFRHVKGERRTPTAYTTMSATRTHAQPATLSRNYASALYSRVLNSPFWCYAGPGSGTNTQAYNVITNRLYDNYISEINIGLLLADLYYAKDTLDVAKVYARKLLHIVRSFTRRDVKAIKYYFSRSNSDFGRERVGKRRYHKGLGEIPAAWLAFNFVYTPLALTVKKVSAFMDDPGFHREFSIRSGRVPVSLTRRVPIDGSKAYEEYTCEGYFSGKSKGFIKVPNPNSGFIQRTGIADIIGTVWDIVPWSWAVDYFTNVSNVFNDLNPRYSTIEHIDWTTNYRGKLTETYRRHLYGKDQFFESIDVDVYNRTLTVPNKWKLSLAEEFSLVQFANLSSAIAMTLKSKLK